MKHYEIWCEGSLVTGNEGIPTPATLLGTFEADTFQQACDMWAETLSDPYSRKCYFPGPEPSFWSCRLFDNEADARKSFG